MRLPLLFCAFFSSLLLMAGELYALSHDLYWRLRWFDIPMHILGGIALGFFVVSLIGWRPYLYSAVLAVLLITWEVFEVVVGMPRQANYRMDTLQDLANGALGALLVFYLARRVLWR